MDFLQKDPMTTPTQNIQSSKIPRGRKPHTLWEVFQVHLGLTIFSTDVS